MAEKAAHLTATTSPLPSVFEVLAQDSLGATVHPALRKLLLFLASTRPQSAAWSWIARHCDELYLVLSAIVQHHYITRHDASFSEYFYGLKRMTGGSADSALQLTTEEKRLSLIFLVVLPYLKMKIDERLACYRLELADGVLFNVEERRVKQAICWLQATAHLVWQCASSLQLLLYVSGGSEQHSPVMRLLGLRLAYGEIAPDSRIGFWTTLLTAPFNWSTLASDAVASCLEVGAFFMQFLHCWQADEQRRDVTALPSPGAPRYDARAESVRGLCPICRQAWRVPAALSVSGYVYCFRCLMRHLQDHSTCPASGVPATVNHIVRLYHT